MLKFNAHDNQLALNYVERWFWPIEKLETASNLSKEDIASMIAAKCVPDAIYFYDDNYGWDSALALYLEGRTNNAHSSDMGQRWYSPAILWWLRRTALLMRSGSSLTEAADRHRRDFVQDFISLLPQIEHAHIAYPTCFTPAGVVEKTKAKEKAHSEWDAWISGAYGVCLREFTARNCIMKEAIGTLVRLHNEEPERYPLNDIELIDLCQTLSTLLAPFSPWERPKGTPGKTIDIALKRLKLGADHPYPFPQSVVSFE